VRVTRRHWIRRAGPGDRIEIASRPPVEPLGAALPIARAPHLHQIGGHAKRARASIARAMDAMKPPSRADGADCAAEPGAGERPDVQRVGPKSHGGVTSRAWWRSCG
jgi:hypothetical protein